MCIYVLKLYVIFYISLLGYIYVCDSPVPKILHGVFLISVIKTIGPPQISIYKTFDITGTEECSFLVDKYRRVVTLTNSKVISYSTTVRAYTEKLNFTSSAQKSLYSSIK